MKKIELNIENYGNYTFDKGITTNEIKEALHIKEEPFLGKINGVRIHPNAPIKESGKFQFRLNPLCGCAAEESNKLFANLFYKKLKEKKFIEGKKDIIFNKKEFVLLLKSSKVIKRDEIEMVKNIVLKKMKDIGLTKYSPLEANYVKFAKIISIEQDFIKEKKIILKIRGIASLEKI